MFLLKNFAGAIFQKSIDSFQLWGVGGGGGVLQFITFTREMTTFKS